MLSGKVCIWKFREYVIYVSVIFFNLKNESVVISYSLKENVKYLIELWFFTVIVNLIKSFRYFRFLWNCVKWCF